MNREFDFDELVDRREVAALKYNAASMKRLFGEEDLFPSWVADMDFKAAPSVIAGLEARAAHGVYGYEYRPGSLTQAIVAWNRERHGWDIEGEHLLTCPSVLNAVAVLVNLFSDEGDGVIVQPPVFFDFKLITNNNGRHLVKNPLKLEDGRYRMDFQDLESKASDPANKLLILCNPHNPVGRVWSRDELERVGDLCRRHDVLVIADEIHADIVFPAHRYTPFASLSDALADISFPCLSPAKSFNIAGPCNASLTVANDARRRACAEFYNRFEINKNNAFANVAMEEAYRHGAPWLDGVLAYLEENVALTRDYLSRHVPAARMIEPGGDLSPVAGPARTRPRRRGATAFSGARSPPRSQHGALVWPRGSRFRASQHRLSASLAGKGLGAARNGRCSAAGRRRSMTLSYSTLVCIRVLDANIQTVFTP